MTGGTPRITLDARTDLFNAFADAAFGLEVPRVALATDATVFKFVFQENRLSAQGARGTHNMLCAALQELFDEAAVCRIAGAAASSSTCGFDVIERTSLPSIAGSVALTIAALMDFVVRPGSSVSMIAARLARLRSVFVGIFYACTYRLEIASP